MRAARTDGNHAAIVNTLKAAGWCVASTARMGGGFPDLMAYKPGKGWRAIEVKTDRGTLTPDQREFHELFPGGVVVIRTIEEAARLA